MCERQTKAGNLTLSLFDPWDMMKNFCFHIYAQLSLSLVVRYLMVRIDGGQHYIQYADKCLITSQYWTA